MKNTLQAFFATSLFLVICGCGSSGGSDVSTECDDYCNFACEKLQGCFNTTSDDVKNCVNTCTDKLDDNGTNAQQCLETQTAASKATCSELTQFNGIK